MNEKQIMDSSAKTVPGFVSLREAAEIMDQEHVGYLVVASDDELIGTISAKDIILHAVSDGKNIYKTTVAEVITANIPESYEDDPANDVTQPMNEKQAHQCLW